VVGVIGGLQTIAQFFIITGGVPSQDGHLNFYVTNIYIAAFNQMRMGYASALSWMLFAVVAALTMIMFKTSKWVNYGEGN
jgi:multiple sugar transport system permease protein